MSGKFELGQGIRLGRRGYKITGIFRPITKKDKSAGTFYKLYDEDTDVTIKLPEDVLLYCEGKDEEIMKDWTASKYEDPE